MIDTRTDDLVDGFLDFLEPLHDNDPKATAVDIAFDNGYRFRATGKMAERVQAVLVSFEKRVHLMHGMSKTGIAWERVA